MMIDDSRQAIVRRFFEAGWNSEDQASISDIVHEAYESNDGGFFRSASNVPGGLERLTGVDAFADHVKQYREMYDDLRFNIDRIVVDGDTVIAVWSPSGTTKERTFTDRGGNERPFELAGQGVSLTSVVDGKVMQHDMFWPRHAVFP